MKRAAIYLFSLLLFTACTIQNSRQASGTAIGMRLGSLVGGATGAITSDSHDGYLIGTAIGAVTGAIAGNKLNAPQQQESNNNKKKKASNKQRQRTETERMLNEISHGRQATISDVMFQSENGSNRLGANEYAKLSFDIINSGNSTINIQPLVQCDNSRITISPMTNIEALSPNDGVRYTVTLQGGSRLKEGNAQITISLAIDGGTQQTVHKLRILTGK